MKKKAHIPDETQLMRELVRYTIGRERADEYPLAPPGLGEILRDRRCVRISDADTLYGAIRDVCGLIDDNRAAQERMAEQLYVQIQGRGANYNANGVALAFLGKKAGEIGLGIVILRSPLIFSDFKVNMLVVLATVDNSTHHPLLLELYRVMNNRRFVRSMITAANSETAEDILTRHAEQAG